MHKLPIIQQGTKHQQPGTGVNPGTIQDRTGQYKSAGLSRLVYGKIKCTCEHTPSPCGIFNKYFSVDICHSHY